MPQHPEQGSWQQSQVLVKYGLDRLFAVVLCILLAPFFLVIAVAIKLDDRGDVFFRQDRLGKNAERFRIWKYRSMVMNADRLLDNKGHVRENRITRVGRLLRLTSLDELPQLFNIAAGHMSFIGPRPVLPEHLDRYTARQKGRFAMKPGVTGLAQVKGRNTLKWSERILLDLDYIENYSLVRDVLILLQTIAVVITRKGVVIDRNASDVDDLGGSGTSERKD